MATAVIDSADQEDSWFGLIGRMKEGAVVPVIGPEVLEVTVTAQDGSTNSGPFYRFVARELCAQYRIECPVNDGRPMWDLHAAAAAVIAEKRENPGKVRLRTSRIINTLASTTSLSPALSALANIDAFHLFVSLTCDDFLSLVIPEAGITTYLPSAKTESLTTPSELNVDIPGDRLGQRWIFRLLGGATSIGFAIHEEDVLEYVFKLQSEASRRVPNALGELRMKDLLFIGCGFPDWLGRSLMRLLNGDRLNADAKTTQEFLSDRISDPSLTAFVSRFSPKTMLFEGEPSAFVDELARRWRAVAPLATRIPLTSPRPVTSPVGGPTAFISYASQNTEAARRLADTLRTLGFADVWLDRKKLIGGDDWLGRIKEAIQSCDYFVPLLSQEADNRRTGIFWREWRYALDRADDVADDFIIPVGIDVKPASKTEHRRIARERPRLFDSHIMHAPDGILSDVDRVGLQERVRRFSEQN